MRFVSREEREQEDREHQESVEQVNYVSTYLFSSVALLGGWAVFFVLGIGFTCAGFALIPIFLWPLPQLVRSRSDASNGN